MATVGMVYDLREDYRGLGLGEEQLAEFDSPETVDGLEAALRGLGHTTRRIGNVRRLAERLVAGERWDIVFNLAEGLAGRSREAQVPALLDAYGVPYTFGDALVMTTTLDKAVAKRLVRDAGVPTAPFAVVDSQAEAAAVDLPFPLFAKPLAEGTGKGVTVRSRVESRRELVAICGELLVRYRQPVLVEPFLPGREVTVGILGAGAGARILGIMEIELLPQADSLVYSYNNKENSEELVSYRLVEDKLAPAAGEVALAAYRALGCADGGRVDIRCDAQGRPMFLEVNPLAGMHPTHSDLPLLARMAGMDYQALVGGILESAMARHGLLDAAPRRAIA